MSIFKLIGGSLSARNTLAYGAKKAVRKEGVHCFAATAEQDFQRVRSAYGKEGGRQALHFALSFAPEELDHTDPRDQQKALEMGVEMALAISPDHQAVCFVHDDQAHLHVHIVLNAVSLADGSKFQMDVSKYRYAQEQGKDQERPNLFRLRKKADAIVRKYGLEPLEPERITQKTAYTRQDPAKSWKARLEREVQAALGSAATLDDFQETLAAQRIGMVIRGQTTTFEDLDRKFLRKKKYKVRSTTLVEGLTTENIFERLNGHLRAESELSRSRKGNPYKLNKNASEAKFEPRNEASLPMSSLQRILDDDVAKWRAQKDYERLQRRIAWEQAQRER